MVKFNQDHFQAISSIFHANGVRPRAFWATAFLLYFDSSETEKSGRQLEKSQHYTGNFALNVHTKFISFSKDAEAELKTNIAQVEKVTLPSGEEIEKESILCPKQKKEILSSS